MNLNVNELSDGRELEAVRGLKPEVRGLWSEAYFSS